MSDNVTKPVDSSVVGDLLNYILNTKDPYKELSNCSQLTQEYSHKVFNYITSAYQNYLHVTIGPLAAQDDVVLQPGDIVFVGNDPQRCYLITQTLYDTITWPVISDEDRGLLNTKGRYRVLRPFIGDKSIAQLQKTLQGVVKEDPYLKTILSEKSPVYHASSFDSDSALQIGDLIFLVDPTQISFSIQQGWQYYPTIRTQGNPKIPTIQQVKNVSVSLIFPNEDSINYQLLNLYAMYKRAPFVNIRNKDICNFYREICFGAWPDQWLSVGLESIQIQSVQGFPNTLMANLTLLPFDYKMLGTGQGFQALKSLRDVKIQQAVIYKNRQLEANLRKSQTKLYQQNTVPTQFDDIIMASVEKSPDFRQSLPFRAMYQALIFDRKFITDERGKTINVIDNKNVEGSSISLEKYRPHFHGNFLYEYKAEDNQGPITLSYNYINDDYRSLNKKISGKEFDLQTQKIDELTKMRDLIITPEGLLNVLVTNILKPGEAYKSITYSINQATNAIPTLLTTYGINLPQGPNAENPMVALTNLLTGGLLNSEQALANLRKAVTSPVQPFNTNPLPPVVVSQNQGISNSDGVVSAAAYIRQICDSIKNDPQKSAKFTQFLDELRRHVINDLQGNDDITLQISPTQDGKSFIVTRIPIVEKTFSINNTNDITMGWSLIFSNKFNSVNLQASKYPFYQHMGSEDAVLSLNITSINDGKLNDLKAELSVMSERIYESTKMIMMNAPELITYCDPRVSFLGMSTHHVFRVFGITKVVYDNSSSVNIDKQPNCWSTNISFTQADLTIAQYHDIESDPISDQKKLIIGTLLASMDLDKNGNVEIRKYQVKEWLPTTPPSYKYRDASLEEILKIRFATSMYGTQFLDSLLALQNKYQGDHLSFFDNFYTRATVTDKLFPDANTFTNAPDIVKKIQDTKFSYVHNIYSDAINPSTVKLTSLIQQYPQFGKVLEYLCQQIDNLFQQEKNSLLTIIHEKSTTVRKVLDHLSVPSKRNVGVEVATSVLNVVAPTVTFGINSMLNIKDAIKGTVSAFVSAGGEATRDVFLNQIDDALSNMIETYKQTMVMDYADKILKDPVIYNNIIKAELLNKDALDTISLEDAALNLKPNCYKDFDLPTKIGDVYLSPDFYLYNDVMDDSEVLSFIQQSLQQYIKIEKLCMMTALEETKTAVTLLDKIKKQNDIIDKDIADNLNNIVLGYLNIKDVTGKLEDVITAIEKTQLELTQVESPAELLKPELVKSLITTQLSSNFTSVPASSTLVDTGKPQEQNSWFLNKNTIDNTDLAKINLLYSARAITLVELFEISTAMNNLMNDKLVANAPISYTKDYKEKDYIKGDDLTQFTLQGANASAAKELSDLVQSILKNATQFTPSNLKNLTTEQVAKEAQDDLKAAFNNVKDKTQSGFASTMSKDYVSAPGLLQLETYIYNKINYFIRLNDALNYSYEHAGAKVDLSNLPELKFLDVWNVRAKEENTRKLELTNTLLHNHNKIKDSALKMYPTFKLYFAEENKNLIRSFDHFYSHNAVQSIEIIANKNTAGKTARIMVSNVTGALTDQLSLMRERSDVFGFSLSAREDNTNIFFGTLDVKPGTIVIIKMGYSADESLLKTVFQGKIMEMSSGPVCELICQSYSSQLNTDIVSERFDFLSTSKAHGDILTAALDKIPGLEKLGKIPMFGLNVGSISGQNFKNLRGKLGEKFLLGNIFGSLSSANFAQDNPRDENIYLDYSVFNDIYHKPLFNWIIQDQSVWEVAQEIALYHRNVIPTVRNYNEDGLSTKQDFRETLIVGEKGGYYKYTSAYDLSSMSIKDVDEACNKWNSSLKSKAFLTNNLSTFIPDIINNKNGLLDLFKFLHNRLNALVLASYVAFKTTQTIPDFDILGNIGQLISDNPAFPASYSLLISNLMEFSNSDPVDTDNIKSFYISSGTFPATFLTDVGRFSRIVNGIQSFKLDTGNDFTLDAKLFYMVKERLNNMNDKYASDPQYKKIQNHHLITDVSNIISNNISLNDNFANMVNVYYTPSPFSNSSQNSDNDYNRDKLNVWSTKAFGDITDENTRVFDSYQKNINTNWFDIINSTDKFFGKYGGYSRLNLDPKANGGAVMGILTKLPGLQGLGLDDKDIPHWEMFPSYVVVGVRLLQKEVEKMYQGTIELVGDPDINPYDVLHIQDYTNNMFGAVEVEEVIHSFTPEGGFKTSIIPNLITYDRDPMQLQDTQIIDQIHSWGSTTRNIKILGGVGASIGAGLAIGRMFSVFGPGIGVGAGLTVGTLGSFNAIVGSMKNYYKFLYDQMGHMLGRDCINFSSLLYHGMPYMAGFDGLDYTSLKTLVNHNIASIKSPLARLVALNFDPVIVAATNNWNAKDLTSFNALFNRFNPATSDNQLNKLNIGSSILEYLGATK